MHPTTRALLEAISRVLDVQPVQSDSAAVLAASTASAAWNAAGRPDLQPLVGGDPPVPGVGWGIKTASSPWVLKVRAVCPIDGGWLVTHSLDDGVCVVDHLSTTALYRPGDPADQPCWRRE